MVATLAEIARMVDGIAPFRLAYDWDNVGLQLGDPSQTVRRLLIALEVRPKVIAYAQAHACGALLVHHPLIFRPQKSIRADDPSGRLQIELIRAGIGLVAAHTNLDRVSCGTNGALAAALDLREPTAVEPVCVNDHFKFVVFVPPDYTPKIIEAIHRGGGAWIGNYSHCTYRSRGMGTYIPEEGANPFSGRVGRFEETEEDRLEAIVPAGVLEYVLHEVKQAHPYEELAYDVYPLHDAEPNQGLGIAGNLRAATAVGQVATMLKDVCSSETTCVAGDTKRKVRRVAIVSGSATGTLPAVIASGAELLVTGELGYHQAMDAVDQRMAVITLGHAASEKIFARRLKTELDKCPLAIRTGLEMLTFDEFPDPFRSVAAQSIRTATAARKPAPKSKKR